jgi:hypothetical protein
MLNILDTLKALPAIATHPLAIVAYILVVAAWLLMQQRTARFNALMKRLELLPPAQRKATLALEMNTVIPDSISAEDWLAR